MPAMVAMLVMALVRRQFFQWLVAQAGLVVYVGGFVTAGASAPSVLRGKRFTVGAPSTGSYTITLDRTVAEFICVLAKIGGATGSNDDVVEIDASRTGGSASANASFVLETQSVAGTAANLTGPIVNFIAIARVQGAMGDNR